MIDAIGWALAGIGFAMFCLGTFVLFSGGLYWLLTHDPDELDDDDGGRRHRPQKHEWVDPAPRLYDWKRERSA